MLGRLLATCGWLADLVIRPLHGTPARRLGRAPAVVAGVLLLVLATLPIAIPLLDPQPEDVGVQDVFDGTVTDADGWVRLRGDLFALSETPTSEHGGPFALFRDGERALRAIVAVTDAQPAEDTVITGHLVPATVVVDEDLPIEATVAGTPPSIVADRILVADPSPYPVRRTWWPLSVPPALLGLVLLIGARAGYPVFQRTREIDVLSAPLRPGERVPAAWGGRIGSNRSELADPAGALLVVRPGPRGNVLTAQPLRDDGGPAPAPVPIGGGWTSGRIGYVHTARESVPALVVRSDLVDATFLFARVAERDRVAALIAIDR
ncbi:MAG TPA: hypothetical protein VLA76_09955 [Candidatus Angelobacter sp.]|nr:hypothetical protein [Candidatus Angelobacter sp.]